MKLEQAEQLPVSISAEKFLTIVTEMMGEGRVRPDDEHPLPPGPWDPVIRTAAHDIRKVYGPHPEPWKQGAQLELWRLGPLPDPWNVLLSSLLERHPELYDVIGGGPRISRGEEVGLNPQPLPPRWAFLSAVVQALVSRAEFMQEIAGLAERAGAQRGIIVVGGYVSQFADDWCATGFKLRWPFHGPRPHWAPRELKAIDLVVMASQFQRAANDAFSPELRHSLAAAGRQFAEKGVSMHELQRAEGAAGGREAA